MGKNYPPPPPLSPLCSVACPLPSNFPPPLLTTVTVTGWPGAVGAPELLLPFCSWAGLRIAAAAARGFPSSPSFPGCFCQPRSRLREGEPVCHCCCPWQSPAPCATQMEWDRSSSGTLPAFGSAWESSNSGWEEEEEREGRWYAAEYKREERGW